MATRRQARQLGLMMAMISVAAGLWPLWSGAAPHWVALGLAGALTAVALLRPAWLGPPATAWRWLGLALHRVTSPVLWAVIYFVVITPVAVLMRLAGRDVLDREAARPLPTIPRAPLLRSTMWMFLRDFFGFLIERKKLWMLPMLLVILLLGGIMALAELTPAGPFIYTLF